MTMTRSRLAFAAACLLAFVPAACSSDSNSGSNTTAAETSAPAAGLSIQGLAFSAATVTAGTEFTITNEDGMTHTVTDDGGTFDVEVPGGGTAKLTIPTAGSYSIHCRIHSSMHGTITVN